MEHIIYSIAYYFCCNLHDNVYFCCHLVYKQKKDKKPENAEGAGGSFRLTSDDDGIRK